MRIYLNKQNENHINTRSIKYNKERKGNQPTFNPKYKTIE